MPDYSDALASARTDADPTSPQGLPKTLGVGKLPTGTAGMPSNLEASNAYYWLQRMADKDEKLKPELEPWMQRLKQIAVQEEGAAAPGGAPPMPPTTQNGSATGGPGSPPAPPPLTTAGVGPPTGP